MVTDAPAIPPFPYLEGLRASTSSKRRVAIHWHIVAITNVRTLCYGHHGAALESGQTSLLKLDNHMDAEHMASVREVRVSAALMDIKREE